MTHRDDDAELVLLLADHARREQVLFPLQQHEHHAVQREANRVRDQILDSCNAWFGG